MKQYPTVEWDGYLEKRFNSIFEKDYFKYVFKRTYLFPNITWDYQWEFIKRINSGLTIVPSKNMVRNIGYGTEATSTTNADNPGANLRSEAITFPLQHPPYVIVNSQADKKSFIEFHSTPRSRIKTFVKSILPFTRVASSLV